MGDKPPKSPEIPENQLNILGDSLSAEFDSTVPSTPASDASDVAAAEVSDTPKLPDTYTAEIPNILNFIWVGNPLPEKYKKNLQQWRKLNPNYEINLWIDRDLLTANQTMELKQFCLQNKITLIDVVDKVKDPNNKTWYKRDLSGYYDSVVGENRNWGIASNFLRALILEEIGGIYLDTDTYPSQKPLPLPIKVPPHGLLLNPIYSPINDIDTALADNIMGSTKGNAVVTEFFRLMTAKYKAYLNSNESVLAMRSRILSDVSNPTYDIVGPDVLADAFLNIEIEKIPFGQYLNRDKLKATVLEKAFEPEERVAFFESYFKEEFDNTWVSRRNGEAYGLYDLLLADTACNPLLNVLNNIKKGGFELNDQFEKIRMILEENEYAAEKIAKIRTLLKDEPNLWKEMHSYFRPGFLSTIVMDEITKQNKFDELVKAKDWSTLIAHMKRMKKEESSSELESPRLFTNALLDAAAKDQHQKVFNALFENRQNATNVSRKVGYLIKAIEAGEVDIAKQLMALGVSCTASGPYWYGRWYPPNAYQIAVQNKSYDLAEDMLKGMLGDLKENVRKRGVDVATDLQSTGKVIFQVGNNWENDPIHVKFFSSKEQKVIACAIWFSPPNVRIKLPNQEVREFNSLQEIVEQIQTQEKSFALEAASALEATAAKTKPEVTPAATSVTPTAEATTPASTPAPVVSYHFDKLSQAAKNKSAESENMQNEQDTLKEKPKAQEKSQAKDQDKSKSKTKDQETYQSPDKSKPSGSI